MADTEEDTEEAEAEVMAHHHLLDMAADLEDSKLQPRKALHPVLILSKSFLLIARRHRYSSSTANSS